MKRFHFLSFWGVIYVLTSNFLLWGQVNRATRDYSESEILRKTIGRVHSETVQKTDGSFEKYLQLRGENAIAGKGFEALCAITYNRRTKNGPRRLLPTAVLGAPHHPADLILFDVKTGEELEQFQAKLSQNAAIEALSDPKYAGMKIVLPPDELTAIQNEIAKRENRGRGLDNGHKEAKRAIAKGRLTDMIDDYKLPSKTETKAFSVNYLKKEHEKTKKVHSENHCIDY